MICQLLKNKFAALYKKTQNGKIAFFKIANKTVSVMCRQ